jgi:hypothetical protein
MEKLRTTHTAHELTFIRTDDGWKVQDPKTESWFHVLTTEFFIIFAEGKAFHMKVKDTENKITFQREDQEDLSVGYDRGTKQLFLDIKPKAFMKKKREFFRVQQFKK